MSQLYAQERPPPIPLSEHQQRRKNRDAAEIVEAARRKGKSEEFVRGRLSELEALLPDLVNLHKLKASDWVTVLNDVNAVAEKLVVIKSVFPKANAFAVVSRMPKLLLQSTARVQQDAEEVRRALSSLPDPDAIIEAVPDLVHPPTLSRSLATLRASFPASDPLEILQKSPEVLYNLGGEADIGDSAEYGELSTKD